MKRTILVVLAIASLLTGCTSTSDQAISKLDFVERSTWEFVISSDQATLTQDPQTQLWQITLTQVLPNLISYTDRPQREAKSESVQSFVDNWNINFQMNGVFVAPNGVIGGLDGASNRITPLPFEISNPTYDAMANTLSFQGRLLNDAIAPASSPLQLSIVSFSIDSSDQGHLQQDCGEVIGDLPLFDIVIGDGSFSTVVGQINACFTGWVSNPTKPGPCVVLEPSGNNGYPDTTLAARLGKTCWCRMCKDSMDSNPGLSHDKSGSHYCNLFNQSNFAGQINIDCN